MDFTAAKVFILKKLELELSSELSYHGKHHTEDVLNAAIELCALENISKHETKLIKTACLFHDAGFIVSKKEHEKYGCELAEKYLPDFGYNLNEVKHICDLIMATKVPQRPKNNLEKIICDADLDYLGRDDFFVIAASLFKELKTQGMLHDENSWNTMQIEFLENHSFFTSANITRRSTKKQEHLKQLKKQHTSKAD